MEEAYGFMLDVRITDNVTCRKYRHSSHLTFIPFHISLAMESHFCGPVTAEALPRKVRVNAKKILAVINATYAVAKRRPEKIRLAGIRTLTSAIPVQCSNQLS